MNWLICNICFRRPLNGVKAYFITSCFHLLCDGCTTPECNVCPKCKQACVTIQLNSRTPEQIKQLFAEISPRRISDLKRALAIQKFQRTNLISYYREVSKKYKHIKALLIANEKNAHILWTKYQDSKAANSVLKRKIISYEEQLKRYQNTPKFHTHHHGNIAVLEPSGRECNYSQIATPRKVYLNANTSVFISPESIGSKTSSRSGDIMNTPYLSGGLTNYESSNFATPKMRVPLTPHRFM